MRSLLPLVFLALAACGSYAKDVATICDAPSKAEVPGNVSPADKATVLAGYIAEHLSSSEGKELFQSLAAVAPEERVRLLRAAATKAGLKSCAFADFFEEVTRVQPKAPAPPLNP